MDFFLRNLNFLFQVCTSKIMKKPEKTCLKNNNQIYLGGCCFMMTLGFFLGVHLK